MPLVGAKSVKSDIRLAFQANVPTLGSPTSENRFYHHFADEKSKRTFSMKLFYFVPKFRCNFQMIHLKIAQHYFRYCPDPEEAYSFLICSQRNGCLSCQQSLALVSLSSRTTIYIAVLGIWRLLEADLRFVGVFCGQWFGYVLLSINAKPLI